MADLKPIIKQRGSVKARVTVFTKYLDALKAIDKKSFTRETICELELKLSWFRELFNQFDELKTKIESTTTEFREALSEHE